ncbi:MAG: hypothetical protein ACE5FL_08785 [Myxococcota bacterium]
MRFGAFGQGGRAVLPSCRARAPRVAAAACLFVLLACAPGGDERIRIRAPGFGPGTLTVTLALSPFYVPGSLEVRLDGREVGGAFEIEDNTATGTLPVGPGAHVLEARARFGGAGEIGVAAARRFRTPAALPPLVSSHPRPRAGRIARTSWFRLSFGASFSDEAADSIALRCDGATRAAAVHAVTERSLVVIPADDLVPTQRCGLVWRGSGGPEQLVFPVAPAGPPARVLYDRGETRHTAPFPDDFWLQPDPADPGRQRLAIEMPDYELPDRLLVDALLEGTRALDGFSPIAHITIELSEAPDPYSLPWIPAQSLDPTASVVLLDVTPGSLDYGARIPFRMSVRTDSAWGRRSHSLLLFPSVSLTPGGRYGVVVTRRVRVDPSRAFEASELFRRARDDAPRDDDPPALRRVRALAEDVFAAAAEAHPPIARREISLAVRFSVRSVDDIPKDLLAIKQEILTRPAPAVSIDRVTRESALEIAGGSDVAAVVHGHFEAIDWRRDGLVLERAAEGGPPVPVDTRQIPFVMALPRAALDGPVPVVMYQHGNPGSAEEEVVPHARQSLARAGFAVIGFTDVLNREVSPPGKPAEARAYDQIFHLMWHLLLLRQVPDYFVQTVSDQFTLLRAIEVLAEIPSFPVGDPGVPDRAVVFGIDPAAPVSYVGVSEGANHAPAFLAFAPEVRAAALVAGGRRFVEVMAHQRPETLIAPLAGLGFNHFTPTDVWVMLALLQTIYDGQDAHNFARYIYREPFEVAGTTRRASILLSEGLNDTKVPNHVTEALAWALGPIPQLGPPLRRVVTLDVAESPIVGNIDGRTTAAFTQFVPLGVPDIAPTPGCSSPPMSLPSAMEGHRCVQNAAEALLQRLVFLETAQSEDAPLVIDPLAR